MLYVSCILRTADPTNASGLVQTQIGLSHTGILTHTTNSAALISYLILTTNADL